MAAAPRSARDPTSSAHSSTDARHASAPLRVLVTAGTYDFDNVGDIAMARVAIDRVRVAHPDARISLLATSQEQLDAHGFTDTRRVADESWRLWSGLVRRWHLRVRPGRPGWQIPFRHPDAFLRLAGAARAVTEPAVAAGWPAAVRDADLVVICGQGAIHDGSDRRTERLAHLVLLADALGTPVLALGQGIGPLVDPASRRLVRRALPRLAGLGLRDAEGSVSTVRALGLAEDRWTVTGDDAVQAAVDTGPPAQLGNRIGVSLRENRAAGPAAELPEVVGAAIAAVRPGVGLELIAMMEKPGLVSDRALLDRVSPAGTPDRLHRAATVADALAGLGRCRVVVTGTYHAAVLAQALGVPVVALAATDYYRQKMHGVVDAFGGGGGTVLDPTALGFTEALAEAVDRWWDRAPDVRGELLDQGVRQAALGREAISGWLAALGLDKAAPSHGGSAPRTVLYVQHYADGGSVQSLLELVGALDRDRYRPVVTFRGPSSFVADFEALGVPVVVLRDWVEPTVAPADEATASPDLPAPPRLGRSSPWRRELRRVVRRDAPAARALRRAARDHRVDLIHANNDVLSNRDAVAVAAVLRRPVVVHVRNLYPYVHDAGWQIDRALARTVDRFLFISHAVAAHHRAELPGGDRGLVIDNPFVPASYRVEPGADTRRGLGLPDGAPVVLSLGRLVRWKGQDVFLRAMALVLREHPDAVALVVGAPAGRRGAAFAQELVELAAELGIADRVRFAGARRDVPAVLAVADLVVHSAVAPEPFGRVVVEAMAAGRPIVAADAGGVGEIVDDGRTGLLVAPGDPEPLARAIAGLLADPGHAAALGAAAAAAAQARFGPADHAEAVQGVYDELLAGRRSRRSHRRRSTDRSTDAG